MANTYNQINIHAVFSVKGRQNLLSSKIRAELFQYISGILKKLNQYPLAVNGYKDHVHIFFELEPTIALSDIMRQVKANSSKWMNENKMVPDKFSWQEGFGGFSYSRSQRNNVIQYIINQEEHHKKKTFKQEYLELLETFEVNFEEKYLFDFFD